MITRIWHGATKTADADKYLQYIKETGLKDYKRTPGNISAKILRKIDKDVCHFYRVTEWKDLGSVIQFAGEDYEKAKYYPEDQKSLIQLEEKVNHFETYT